MKGCGFKQEYDNVNKLFIEETM